jgi:hypothetical protein
MKESFRMAPLIRGLFGAAIGGVIGFYVFEWILSQDFYALVLPGAVLGMGFGVASREHSKVCGIVSGILALGLGLFVEWNRAPFRIDDSFSFFLKNFYELKPIQLIMIGLGGLIAFWFGVGRETISSPQSRESSTEQD